MPNAKQTAYQLLKNRAFVLDLATILIVFLVTATEAALVEPGQRSWYVGIRALIALALAVHAGFSHYKERVWYGVLWAVILYAYSASGEYFRPLYIIALFQFQAIHAVYFRHSRRSFFATHLVGTAIFLAVMTHVWSANVVKLHAAEIQDQLSIAVCSLISATFLYFYFESIKSRAEAATNKLALVGSYATSLIHDIKNLSSAPLLYAEMLNDDSRQLSKADVTRVAQLLHTDLTKLERLVKDLYDTSKPEDTRELCSLKEACDFSIRVLSTRLNGVTLKIEGDSSVQTNKRILNVILLNLFYNSLNAFKKFTPGEQRLIEIQISENVMVFVSHSYRKELTDKDAEKTKGLGLYLIEELGKQSNVHVEREIDGSKWITRMRFSF